MTFENDLFELVNGHPILQYSIARTWGEMHIEIANVRASSISVLFSKKT